MNLFHRFAILGLALVIAGFAEAATNKTLKLRVVDSVTQKLIDGFTVESSDAVKTAEAPITGENGIAKVTFNPHLGSSIIVTVRHPDFVPVHVMWRKNKPDVELIPGEHTVALERGVPVGGVVKDDSGRPLTGVKVHFTGELYYRKSPSQTAAWPSSISTFSPTNNPTVMTDSQGRWRFERFPTNTDRSPSIVVQRANGAVITFHTEANAWPQPEVPESRVISPATLRSFTAELTVPHGRTMKLKVVGLDGKPLVGARLLEKPNRHAHVSHQVVFGDAGLVTLSNRPPENICYLATADGFASAVAIAKPVNEDQSLELRLEQGRSLAIEIQGDDGRPLAGVSLGLRDNQHLDFPSGAKTDEEGVFIWNSAPKKPVRFWLSHPDYATRVLATDGVRNPESFQFKHYNDKKALVDVTARSVSDDKPIPEFVVLGHTYGIRKQIMSISGTNGAARGEIRKEAWPQGYPYLEVSVEAKGFQSMVAGSLDFYEGDHEFSVELKPLSEAKQIAIRRPDGLPADKAIVHLLQKGQSVFVNNGGEVRGGRNARKITADEKGQVRAVGLHDIERVVVAHESGLAEFDKDEFLAQSEIDLPAWGLVDGVAKETGQPLANNRIRLGNYAIRSPLRSLLVSLSTHTDEDGYFVFEKVPPGDLFLSRSIPSVRRGPIIYSHQKMINVKPASILEVKFGGSGRVVTGSMETSVPGQDIDWQWDRQRLVKKVKYPRQPAFNDFATNEEFAVAQKRYFQSAELREAWKAARTYQLTFDRLGNFRVADVEPGVYHLSVRLTEPLSERQRRLSSLQHSKEIGSYTAEVVVPEGPDAEPVNLGKHVISITGRKASLTKLPDLTFHRFDGGTLNLANHRGKPIILALIAEWCLSSQAALERLSKMHADPSARKESDLIGISLDGSLQEAKDWKEQAKLNWLRGWASPEKQLELVRLLNLKGTPSFFVVAHDGTLVGRDVELADVRGYLARASALRESANE